MLFPVQTGAGGAPKRFRLRGHAATFSKKRERGGFCPVMPFFFFFGFSPFSSFHLRLVSAFCCFRILRFFGFLLSFPYGSLFLLPALPYIPFFFQFFFIVTFPLPVSSYSFFRYFLCSSLSLPFSFFLSLSFVVFLPNQQLFFSSLFSLFRLGLALLPSSFQLLLTPFYRVDSGNDLRRVHPRGARPAFRPLARWNPPLWCANAKRTLRSNIEGAPDKLAASWLNRIRLPSISWQPHQSVGISQAVGDARHRVNAPYPTIPAMSELAFSIDALPQASTATNSRNSWRHFLRPTQCRCRDATRPPTAVERCRR